jgi:hypothetical protein
MRPARMRPGGWVNDRWRHRAAQVTRSKDEQAVMSEHATVEPEWTLGYYSVAADGKSRYDGQIRIQAPDRDAAIARWHEIFAGSPDVALSSIGGPPPPPMPVITWGGPA